MMVDEHVLHIAPFIVIREVSLKSVDEIFAVKSIRIQLHDLVIDLIACHVLILLASKTFQFDIHARIYLVGMVHPVPQTGIHLHKFLLVFLSAGARVSSGHELLRWLLHV